MRAFFTWLAASTLGLVAATPLPRRDDGPTYFFTFGNSYSSTGFDPSGGTPSASNPMGNPELGTGTTAGGPNWVGYLTTAQNASLVLSYNLAYAGATIDNSIVSADAEDLVTQVDIFQSVYSNKTKAAPWTSENAVFGFWIGINDVGNACSNTDAEKVTPKLIARYRSLVEKIYRDGGRKFLFLNVPATSRTPKFLEQGDEAVKAHATYLSVFNEKLESMVKSFTASHEDVCSAPLKKYNIADEMQTTAVLYDSWSFMTKVLDNPQEYGFPNATCIDDDGHSCIWWNKYHPTSKYHGLQAKDMKEHLKPLGAW